MNKPLNTLLPFMLLASATLLGGCNTLEGAGEDLEAGGEALQECADGDGNGCED